MRTIDTTKRSHEVLELQKKFASRIVGQEEATAAITNCLEKYLGGLSDSRRPIASLLFLRTDRHGQNFGRRGIMRRAIRVFYSDGQGRLWRVPVRSRDC